MEKKKPLVKTIQSRSLNPKITKPTFSSTTKKGDSTIKIKESPKFLKNQNLLNQSKSNEEKNQSLFQQTPSLISAKKDQVDELFIKKCKSCFQMCDFSKESSKENILFKEEILKEILSSLKDPDIPISDSKEVYQTLFALISIHMLRTPNQIPNEWYPVSDYFMLNDEYHPENFVHIDIIYDIAMALFKREKFNKKISIELTGDLFKLCIYLTRTADDREQQKLAGLITTIYSTVKELRPFFFDVIKTSIMRIIYNDEPFTSAKTLLVVLASIIGGLHILLQKHRDFFFECIIPLHSSHYLVYFAQEIMTTINQFLEKENQLVFPLFKYIIKHWPLMNSQKQLILLDEIAWFASYVELPFLDQTLYLVIPQLMESLASCQTIVSEKILSMWEINDFVWMMVVKPNISYPLIIPKIFEVASSYWNPDICIYATAVLNILNLNNKESFRVVGENLKNIQNRFILNSLERGEKWRYLIQNYEENAKEKHVKQKIIANLFIGCDAMLNHKQEI